MSVGGVTFPLEQQSKDPQSVVYTGQYNTEGVAHTKSGERQPVQINIQVWMTQHRPGDPLFLHTSTMFPVLVGVTAFRAIIDIHMHTHELLRHVMLACHP